MNPRKNISKWTQEIEDDVFYLKFEKNLTAAQVSDEILKKHQVRLSKSAILGRIHRVINANVLQKGENT